jgi:hypothetical protein
MATTTFNDLITFSRGTNATLTGPNGLVQWAPNNLVTNSQDFEASAWSKNAVTVTANTTTAPDGTSTADTITESATNDVHVAFQSNTLSALTTHVMSVYVQAGTRSFAMLRVGGGGFSTGPAIKASLTGAGTTTTLEGPVVSSAITAVGSGWYRVSMTFVSTATTAGYTPQVGPHNNGNAVTYLGDGTSGILIWGAQLELGTAATDYNNTSVRNLLGFSEAFDNAAWTKVRASIVTGAQANPLNGLFNAQKLMEDTSNNSHFAQQAASSVVGGTPVTVSTYAKAAGRNFFAMVTSDQAGTFRTSYFDLANGTLGTVASGHTASITAVGNGWYRCAITQSQSATTGVFTYYPGPAAVNGSTAYQGDGNSGVFIYGAQLSNSASLDPYVPTPGAAPSSTAYYGPRFDFDPVTLQPRGLLIEEQRTNLRTFSEDLTNSVYVKTDCTISSNTAVAPDGTTTADTIVENTANAPHFVFSPVTITGGATTTFSVFLKAANRNAQVRLQSNNGTFSFVIADINLANGTQIGATSSSGASGISLTIASFNNGWYRVVVTAALAADVTSAAGYVFTYNGGISYAGNGTSGVLAWGWQHEAGTFATSYIPTVASQVTRAADVATITGQNFSQWYNQGAGTFVISMNTAKPTSVTGPNRAFTASDGTESNRVATDFVGSSVRGIVSVGAVNQALISVSYSDNSIVNAALAYRTDDFAFTSNGGSPVTDVSGTVPTSLNSLILGAQTGSAAFLNGHIRRITYYPTRLSNAQLQALTV